MYVCRLVINRAFARQGLGAALLDWAGLRARRWYGARWIRVDVWTTNTRLHTYYQRQGFGFCGFSEAFQHYPAAGALPEGDEPYPADRAEPCSASSHPPGG